MAAVLERVVCLQPCLPRMAAECRVCIAAIRLEDVAALQLAQPSLGKMAVKEPAQPFWCYIPRLAFAFRTEKVPSAPPLARKKERKQTTQGRGGRTECRHLSEHGTGRVGNIPSFP